MKRCFRTVAVCILLTLWTAACLLPIAAVEPVYAVGAEYNSSPYYTALTEYTLTGDERYDVLAVAFTQLGYHEGDTEEEMHGANPTGTKNFAEYNRIYGKLDNGEGNGVSYGYSWCAAFVSWCLRHANVESERAVTEVSCRRMTDWYRENATFHARESGYTPKPGDIIMFHDGDRVANHVGLVYGTAGGYVYVIDGNGREESVATHVYHRRSRTILGYCVPDYETVPGTAYDFLTAEEAAEHSSVSMLMTVSLAAAAVVTVVVLSVLIRHRKSDSAERK